MNPATSLSVRRTLTVDAPRDRTFETFLNVRAWWPLATHALGRSRRNPRGLNGVPVAAGT